MKITIIILTYNSSRYIEKLLESITTRYEKVIQKMELEVLVADNASTDNTVNLAEKFKNVKVVENGDNFGFAKGNNLAAKKALGDILVFINPDAKFTDGDIFDMTEVLKDHKVGVVGGNILNYNGGRELSCGKFYNLLNTLLLSIGLEEAVGVRFAPKKEQEVDFVSGAFLAIRRELFEKLNGFDEHYFMYIEDSDLCFRVKKAGFSVVFSPKATIQHVGQGSSNRTFAIVNIYKGLLYFNKKHMGSFSYIMVKFALRIKAILLVMLGKVSHNKYLVTTYEQAFSETR